jgi:tRNA threonylcarbamoyl adenosine modification protein YeaZ
MAISTAEHVYGTSSKFYAVGSAHSSEILSTFFETNSGVLKTLSNLVLGIESAIFGGSIALSRGGDIIASWVGTEKLSGAESVLPTIDKLLGSISADVQDLETVIVSTGPGSFTGIRVGIATVLGLRASTGARCVGLTAFRAISSSSNESRHTVALPMGRDMICLQQFVDRRPVSEPRLVSRSDLVEEVTALAPDPILAHDSIYSQFAQLRPEKAINIGSDIASFLCRAAHTGFTSEDLRPLFVDRKAFNKI